MSRHIIDDDPMDDLLPDAEVLRYQMRRAGLDAHYNIRELFDNTVDISEDSMAFDFIMSQDPWDDDWGN